MPFDRKSRADVTRLRDYVTANSPGGEDFTTATDVRLADVMNAPTTSPVARPLVTARDLMIAVDSAEYVALPAARQRAWQAVLTVASAEGVDPSDVAIIDHVSEIWSGATNTLAALGSLRNRPGTHAEVEFGAGTSLVHLDIAAARTA